MCSSDLAQTVTFAPASTLAVGGKLTLVATASSKGAVTFATTTPTVCSISGSTLTGLKAGACVVVATQAGDTSFAKAETTATIVIGGTPLVAKGYLGTSALTTNPAKVAKGKTVTLKLTTGTKLAGKSVTLEVRIGTGAWTKVTTKKLDSAGRTSYSFTMTRTDVTYRWRYGITLSNSRRFTLK